MIIADTFAMDRHYKREFRKLLAVSFQKRSYKSIQSIINPTREHERGTSASSVSAHKPHYSRQLQPLPYSQASMQTQPYKYRIISTQSKCKSFESSSSKLQSATDEPEAQEKVLSFLDSNIVRIHQNKKEATLRKKIKYNARCFTEANRSSVLRSDIDVNGQFCMHRRNYAIRIENESEMKKSQQLKKQQPRRRRYSRVPRYTKLIDDKENTCSGFCPWECADVEQFAS